MADRIKVTTVSKTRTTGVDQKINIRASYGAAGHDKEDDDMCEWVMSLNGKQVSKQRKDSGSPPASGQRGPKTGHGLSGAKHKEWYNRHVVTGDTHLVEGLTIQDRKDRKQWMKQALKWYKRADEHYPISVSVRINRCIAFEELGDLIQAAAEAEKALEKEPDNERALYRLARVRRLSGDAIQADFLYKKCFQLSGALEVWKEMTDARLEYLMRTEECTAEQVDEAHLLADSLTQASLFVRAMRNHAADKEEAGGPDPDQIRRKIRLSETAIADFIILDMEKQVKNLKFLLTPTNIFCATGVHVYNCICTDEAQIRSVFGKYGSISSVNMTDEFVSIEFDDAAAATTAVCMLSGSTRSGLSGDDKRLTVRFSPNVRDMGAMIGVCLKEGQCLGWRTTGCHFKNQCKFRHLEADFRVDLQPDMLLSSSPFLHAAEKQNQRFQQLSKLSNGRSSLKQQKPQSLVLAARRGT